AYSSAIPYMVQGKQCILMFTGKGLATLDATNGKEVMEFFPWPTMYQINVAVPVISGNQVFLSSGYNQGATLLEQADGKWKQVWKNTNMRNHMSTCVLREGYLYGFDEGNLRCIDWKTGDVKWSNPSLGKGSLMLSDGKLIIMSEKCEL